LVKSGKNIIPTSDEEEERVCKRMYIKQSSTSSESGLSFQKSKYFFI